MGNQTNQEDVEAQIERDFYDDNFDRDDREG